MVKQALRITRAMKEDMAKQMRRVTTAALKNLAATTPVDTGYAVGNWQIGIGNNIPDGEVELRSKQSMLASGVGKLASYKTFGPDITIVNNITYIGRLNAGSSTQAPAGFVQSALSRAVEQVE